MRKLREKNNPPEVEIEENKEKPGHLQSHPHNHEEKIGDLEGDVIEAMKNLLSIIKK